MTYNELSAMIMGETNDIIYISDLETYELRYLNQAAIRLFRFQEEGQWMGKPCYRVLQSRESPCPFCTSHLLTDHAFYAWEHYNTAMGRYFSVKDKRVNLDGRPCRLELATDITEKELSSQKLCQKLLEEETLVSCIQTLDRYADAQKAIGRLLEIVGGYYGAERSYIFEREGEEELLSNTYEWCRQGVEPQRENLQKVPRSIIDRWVE